ncbi:MULTISPECIES: hypothetical protein [Methylobacteriaceae]|uniref:Uncharacterized protein n=2 Tax=Methylobacteriaceae TaxID=119045 RepID=A0A169QL91_9HYPH|nr:MULTISPECIES: hypothetical protein [Methylobacteriaceae]MDV2984007.1 hypothetical protein [Methylobacteriaceae bacterium AG10]RUP02570.1 MAG: hypothetical protein EKK34_23585 [Mycobacterium sp.]MBY0255758.1 hypothetical protein [Methylobacterium organophilum]BAU89075.1 hypothetical protein MPPM_0470 [Methylorubrum populi]GJE28779.1 hypothetical protein LKMONMHP_3653 [Methylobacterium organophilum]
MLAHPALRREDRRAILAEWASDAHAVASFPGLRRLPGTKAAVVDVDDVLAALAELDAAGTGAAHRAPGDVPRRRPLRVIRDAFRPRRRDDDDDDPPPPRPPAPIPDAVAVAA